MRTLVDIGDPQIEALDTVAKRNKRSRSALIRQALEEYLDRHGRQSELDAFGLWGDRKVDGLEYQEKIRGEW